MKTIHVLLFVMLVVFSESCSSQEEPNTNAQQQTTNDWLIPVGEVRDGGPGKDGIPALIDPPMITPEEATYLDETDLVIGYVNSGEAKAYSHKVLDWHEIINDNVGGKEIAITYCPLTGTAIGWNRNINGETTTFGVSGLLYNSNLIPYDRSTGSNWTQIGLTCVNGNLIGEKIPTYQLVETSWATWKTLYPETKVVSTNTGHSRNYERYPYGQYRTAEGLIFAISEVDDRLHQKERVHAIISNDKIKAYRLSHFENPIIQDEFEGRKVVLIGSEQQNFIVSFFTKELNGEALIFSLSNSYDEQNGFTSSEILEDQFGNQWDIFGNAISGPNTGEKLTATNSFIGYWFSFASFYSNPEIYNP